MRFVFIFLASLSFLSCAAQQPRNADLVVTYENRVIHSVGPSWNTQKDLHQAIELNKRPIRVIFTAQWCGFCQKLRSIVTRQGWRDQVYYLNFDEAWVKKLAVLMDIRTVPTMISFDGKDGEKVKKIPGWGGIVLELANELNKKE
jgi:thioredoxin-related protein